MDNKTLVRSHIERCLEDLFEERPVVRDAEGDYPFRWKSAACWVQVQDRPSPVVRVMAHAVHGVKGSAALLREINDLNTSNHFARVTFSSGYVVVDYQMPWEAVEFSVLSAACSAVSTVAAESGPVLTTVFGGRTPFGNCEETHDQESA